MAARQDYPSSLPGDDIANVIQGIRENVAANSKAIASGCLPDPLLWRVTTIVAGPPPTFQVEIVNSQTGASIILGII